ncbi:hypothetical protein HW555_010314 [Spodoptera exigua]|uniref:Secreted protein n=1 Tax=Spodoptera exigua TaxID=7107 RepID=A0A835L5S7_SPOEX|nr:hypothetical protein HW555_010314 [Spodoptera exigua]
MGILTAVCMMSLVTSAPGRSTTAAAGPLSELHTTLSCTPGTEQITRSISSGATCNHISNLGQYEVAAARHNHNNPAGG